MNGFAGDGRSESNVSQVFVLAGQGNRGAAIYDEQGHQGLRSGHSPKELLAEMGKLTEEMRRTGVLLASDGLQPSAKGTRIQYSGGKRTLIDGPFAETKD